MNNITFSPEFINEFDGTYQELISLINRIQSALSSNAINDSAVIFDTGGFEQILEITI